MEDILMKVVEMLFLLIMPASRSVASNLVRL